MLHPHDTQISTKPRFLPLGVVVRVVLDPLDGIAQRFFLCKEIRNLPITDSRLACDSGLYCRALKAVDDVVTDHLVHALMMRA